MDRILNIDLEGVRTSERKLATPLSPLGPVETSNFSCAETKAQITKIYFHLFKAF